MKQAPVRIRYFARGAAVALVVIQSGGRVLACAAAPVWAPRKVRFPLKPEQTQPLSKA